MTDETRRSRFRRAMTRSPYPGLALVLGGASALVLALSQTGGDPATPGSDAPAPWVAVALFAAISALAIGVVALQGWGDRRAIARNPTNRARQVHELKHSLDKALTIVTAFRDEIEQRDELLRELEERAETHRALAELNAAEVDAVVEQLRAELRREGRRGLVRDLLLGALFFAAGIVASLYLGR